MKQLLPLIIATLLYSQLISQCNILCNGGADSIAYPDPINLFLDSSLVPCWKTTATDGKIEVWNTVNQYNYNSYSGSQFLEINSTMPATLYQVISANPNSTLTISFAHRGRENIDTVAVEIGVPGGPYTLPGKYGDSKTNWGYYSVNYTVPNLGNIYHIRFRSVYWLPGVFGTYGNFIDAISICTDGSNQVGIKQYFIDKIISISPNPSNGQFIFSGLVGENKIEVIDIAGRLLYAEKTNAENHTLKLNAAQGIYFYKITDKQNRVQQGKLIIN